MQSRVKLGNKLNDAFECSLGVRQGESLSPFLFSMFLNDIEDVFMNKGLSGKDVKFFKIFLILYADDIVIFAESKDELQYISLLPPVLKSIVYLQLARI